MYSNLRIRENRRKESQDKGNYLYIGVFYYLVWNSVCILLNEDD